VSASDARGARGRAERRSGGDVGDVMAFFTGTIVFQTHVTVELPHRVGASGQGQATVEQQRRWSGWGQSQGRQRPRVSDGGAGGQGWCRATVGACDGQGLGR
jgi:hypothetical protein